METLYRKILCSERLPDRDGVYNTQIGELYLLSKRPSDRKWRTKTALGNINVYYPAWWLEELPPQEQATVEDIRKILYDEFYQIEWKASTPFKKTKFAEDEAQAIHSLVYGEKGGEG